MDGPVTSTNAPFLLDSPQEHKIAPVGRSKDRRVLTDAQKISGASFAYCSNLVRSESSLKYVLRYFETMLNYCNYGVTLIKRFENRKLEIS